MSGAGVVYKSKDQQNDESEDKDPFEEKLEALCQLMLKQSALNRLPAQPSTLPLLHEQTRRESVVDIRYTMSNRQATNSKDPEAGHLWQLPCRNNSNATQDVAAGSRRRRRLSKQTTYSGLTDPEEPSFNSNLLPAAVTEEQPLSRISLAGSQEPQSVGTSRLSAKRRQPPLDYTLWEPLEETDIALGKFPEAGSAALPTRPLYLPSQQPPLPTPMLPDNRQPVLGPFLTPRVDFASLVPVQSRDILSPAFTTGNHPHKGKTTSSRVICNYCKTNRETMRLYTSHQTKVAGIVTCPVLRRYVCPSCGATGDHAHTASYCPVKPRESMAPLYTGKRRNSCGSWKLPKK